MSQAQLIPTASPFQFNDFPVRTQSEGDQLWFAARDVCTALGLKWHGKVLLGIPEGWQSMRSGLTLRRGTQNIRFISEPAVYKLAFRSNKPEADAFTNWIASEVVPAIRKTGKYEAAPKKKALGRGIKALSAPVAAQPSYRENCAEVTAKMLQLRGDLFTITQKIVTVFRNPFWGPGGHIPEDKKPFADAMNYAVQAFQLAVNKDLETMELLFRAYVEGEKILNG